MKFYIYCLISSLDEKVFYVGKGSGKRMYSHVRIAKSNGVNILAYDCNVTSDTIEIKDEVKVIL